jgi:3-hydroxyisobutyrate dehydrogenase-like beta-hydroxyacid dehydrogenase
MTQRIGFIGLGRMGQRMASRLTDAGFQLTGFDVDMTKADALRSRGAIVAQSPADLASQSVAVITSVTDGLAVLRALSGPAGLLSTAAPGLLLIEMSTIGVDHSRQVAEACGEAGVRYVRAPVLGALGAAAGGTLNGRAVEGSSRV